MDGAEYGVEHDGNGGRFIARVLKRGGIQEKHRDTRRDQPWTFVRKFCSTQHRPRQEQQHPLRPEFRDELVDMAEQPIGQGMHERHDCRIIKMRVRQRRILEPWPQLAAREQMENFCPERPRRDRIKAQKSLHARESELNPQHQSGGNQQQPPQIRGLQFEWAGPEFLCEQDHFNRSPDENRDG